MSERSINRREAIKLGTSTVIMFGFFRGYHPFQSNLERPKVLGTTLSQKQCDYFGLDPLDTLKRTIDMGFDQVRLCVYWDEYEEGKRDRIEALIKETERNKLPFILNFGAKAARWPEWHLPKRIEKEIGDLKGRTLEENPWFTEQLLKFNDEILNSYAKSPYATILQPGNESLIRMSLTQNADEGFNLQKEQINIINSVKRDNQSVLTSTAIYLWPPISGDDEVKYHQNLALNGQLIGVNYYSTVAKTEGGYLQDSLIFWQKAANWARLAQAANKIPWVTELQAEPWENGHLVYKESATSPSSSPEKTFRLLQKVQSIGYKNILLWGVEHWIYHSLKGDDTWIKSIVPFIQRQIT